MSSMYFLIFTSFIYKQGREAITPPFTVTNSTVLSAQLTFHHSLPCMTYDFKNIMRQRVTESKSDLSYLSQTVAYFETDDSFQFLEKKANPNPNPNSQTLNPNSLTFLP